MAPLAKQLGSQGKHWYCHPDDVAWPSPSSLHSGGNSPREGEGSRGHSPWEGRQSTVYRSVAS